MTQGPAQTADAAKPANGDKAGGLRAGASPARRCRTHARAQAPALEPWLASGTVRLGDLLRHPEARDTELEALALFVVRGGQSFLTPRPDLVLAPGDELLLPASPRRAGARHDSVVDSAAEYVLHGRASSGRLALAQAQPRPVGPRPGRGRAAPLTTAVATVPRRA